MKKKIFSIALLGLLSTLNADVISKNGIAKDSATGLQWQDEPYTQAEQTAYDKSTNSGKAGKYQYAKAYCENLTLGGFSDWRLPNIYELTTLIDNTKSNKPYIIDGFDNVISEFFLSSTQGDSYYIWNVAFGYGDNNWFDKTFSNYIRCVRDEPLNFDNLLVLKNKANIKVNQENIDKISPNIEKIKAQKEAEREKQELQTKSVTTRPYNSWKTGDKYENTSETYAPSKYISTEIKCLDGTTGTVLNYYLRKNYFPYMVNVTNLFHTFDDAANYICGN